MAYDVDRRPGVFAKRRESVDVRVALVFLALVLVALVVCAGLLLTGTSGVVAALALVFVGFAGRHFFETRLEFAGRWGKGGNAEVAVGLDLEELRHDGYVVMHDLENVVGGNVDHLVSGPTGVFMVETKYRRYVNTDIAKAKRVAATIADELGTRWVQPVICCATRDYGPRMVKGVAVVGRRQLLPYVRSASKPVVPFDRLAAFADRQ